ncbi:MAG: hypothetical protein GC181_08735 [Bacteroidetes bacterium]|nr:hypothetical protein [Bacteroidota bacterium]
MRNKTLKSHSFFNRIYLLAVGIVTPLFSFAQYGGTYTVHPATGHFTSVQEAADSLMLYGISSNVVIEIESGTYNEQVELGLIPGTGGSDSVVFRSASGNRDDVLITYSSSNSAKPFTLNLAKSRNVTFRNLRLSSTGTYARTIQIGDSCKHLRFDNCLVESGITNSHNQSGFYSVANGIDSLTILNSVINHCAYGMYFSHSFAGRIRNLSLINDSITGFSSTGLYISGFEDFVGTGNYVGDDISSSTYGLYLYSNPGNFRFSSNQVNCGFAQYGLLLTYINGTQSTSRILSNNFVSLTKTSGTQYAAYFSYCDTLSALNNSFSCNSTTSSTQNVVLYLSGSRNINLTNNIANHAGSGFAMLTANSTSIISDYNCFYSLGYQKFRIGNNGYNSFSEYVNSGSNDQHSIFRNPYFNSVSDLHTNLPFLDNAGITVSSVTVDFDGESRNNPPCIGADEFTASAANPLRGFYTIDSSGSGNRNYLSFTEAAEALSYYGIDSSVIFEVATGTYREAVNFGIVAGASSQNRIYFRPQSGNVSDVVVCYPTGSGSTSVFTINSTYLNFSNLTFRAAQTDVYNDLIRFNLSADFIRIDSCLFKGRKVSSSSQYKALYSNAQGFRELIVTHCEFDSCSYAIQFANASGVYGNYVNISNNRFTNFTESGVYIQYATRVVTNNNYINNTFSYTGYGLYISLTDSSVVAEGNEIYLNGGSYGLYVYYLLGKDADSSRLANNLISMYSTANYASAIYLYSSSNCRVYHNNLFRNASTLNTSDIALNIRYSTNINVKNNILHGGESLTMVFYSCTQINSDYNCHFSGSAYKCGISNTFYTTLSSFTSATALDSHSINIDPKFFSSTDIHTTRFYLYGAGIFLSDAPADINGNNRQNPPCIGADEFSLSGDQPMSGNYTIDSSGSGNRNFISLSKAVAALDSLGISADVNFTIANGIYIDPVTIGQISGSDDSRKITFRGSGSTVFSFVSGSSGNTKLILLNDAINIRFAGINFYGSTSNSYTQLVQLSGALRKITFDSCSFIGKTGTSSYPGTLVGGSLQYAENIRISECILDSSSYGIYLNSTTGNTNGIEITHCEITNFSYAGLYVNQALNMNFSENHVESNGFYYTYGMYVTNTDSNLLMEQNNILIGNGYYALYMGYCDGNSSHRARIVNNRISNNSNGNYGYFLFSNTYIDFIHNSVRAAGTTFGSSNAGYISGGSNYRHYNNIYDGTGSYAFRITDKTILTESDYNSYFSNGVYLVYSNGISITNLASWQNYSSLDSHSIVVNPYFTDWNNLVTAHSYFDNAGILRSGINSDFSGNSRANPPCIGADEFVVAQASALSGNYTINPALNSSNNFKSFNKAVRALDSLGISGPVEFEVASGIYTEQFTLGRIIGSSSTNTVIFYSGSANRNDVQLKHTASGASDNYVVRFKNTRFVTFRGMSIMPQGAQFTRAVEFVESSSHVWLDSMFLTNSGGTTSNSASLVYGAGLLLDSFNRITNSLLDGGSFGINYQSVTGGSEHQFLNDSIINFYYQGIYAYRAPGIISGNIISTTNGSNCFGISSSYNNQPIEISYNQIYISNAARGLEVNYSPFSVNSPGKVYNNFISGTASGSMELVYITATEHLHFYHNNIYASTSAGGSAMRVYGSNDSILFNGNIFHNTSGYAVNITNSSYLRYSDYNDFFTTGSQLFLINATAHNSLAAWQSATGFDANSLDVLPGFTGASDLHTSTADLYNAGDASAKSVVSDDIDGEERTTARPCIGADEFTPDYTYDIILSNIISPYTECGLDSILIRLEIINNSNSSQDSIPFSYSINGGNIITDTLFTAVGPGEKDTFTFPDKVSISALSSFTFESFIDFSSDENSANDTLRNTFNNYAAWSHSVTEDTSVCAGSYVVLEAIGGTHFLWNNGSTSNLNTIYVGNSNQTHRVTITNALGCRRYDTIQVYSLARPTLTYVGETGYAGSYVEPQIGPSTTAFMFKVKYSDAGNNPPVVNPILQIDGNNNYAFSDLLDYSFNTIEVDLSDTLYSDGKLYRVKVTGLTDNDYLRSRFTATNSNGCAVNSTSLAEPLVDDDLVDLRIWANSISFSDWNPEPTEGVTIDVVVNNTSNYSSDSFLVALYVAGSLEKTWWVSNVGPKSSVSLSHITSFDTSGFYPIRVLVDSTNRVTESNELNNLAIRPVIVGDFNTGATIAITDSLSSDKVYPGEIISFAGYAQYIGTNSDNSAVQGAQIEFSLSGENKTIRGFTNSQGSFNVSFAAPTIPGKYVINGEFTDYTLTTRFGPDTIEVISRPVNPYNLTAWIDVDSSILVQHDSSAFHARVTNTGDSVCRDFYIRLRYDNQVILNQFVASLEPDSFLTFDSIVVFPVLGSHSISVMADATYLIKENTESDNYYSEAVLVLPPLPDLEAQITSSVVNNLSTPYNLSYYITNQGGMPSGKFYFRVIDSTVSGSRIIRYDSVNSIQRLSTRAFTDNIEFETLGCHLLIVEADLPVVSGGIVTEVREDNNTSNITLCHSVIADLATANGHINAQPVKPVQAGDTLYLTNTFFNIGTADVADGDSIEVKFIVTTENHLEDTTLKVYYKNGLATGASRTEIISIPTPQFGDNLLQVRIDDPNYIVESTNLNNIARIPLCWDFSVSAAKGYSYNNIYVGDYINLVFDVSNRGLYTGTNVKVHMIVDDTVDGGWYNFTSVYPTGRNYVTGGTNLPYRGSLGYAFPTSGDHKVKFVVDADSAYIECREFDNADSMTIHINELKPDLVIRSYHIAPEALNPNNGDSVAIVLNYENQGKVETDSFVVRCTVNDDQLGSEITVPGLRPGRDTSILVDEKWKTIGGISVIRGEVDYLNEITETDELNNIASRAIVGGPDDATNLRFTDLVYSNAPCNYKGNVSITARVFNDGHKNNRADIGLYGYVLLNGDTVGFPAFVHWNEEIGFPAGDTTDVVFTNAIPINIAASTNIQILAVVGYIDDVQFQEYNEFDNQILDTACWKVPAIQLAGKNATCNGFSNGYIAYNIDYAQGPYDISISKYDSSLSPVYLTTFQSGEYRDTIRNLAPGLYRVEVFASGNTRPLTDTVRIGEPDPIVIEGVVSTTSCAGGIDVTVTGGTPCGDEENPHYNYLWLSVDSSYHLLHVYDQDLERTASGDYMVIVQDCNLCYARDTFSLEFEQNSLAGASIDTSCSYRDTQEWTYLLHPTNNGLISGIYNVHPDSTYARITINPLHKTITSRSRTMGSRVVQLHTLDTAGTDSFDVRLYYSFGEIDSLIANNPYISSISDIRIHKYSGPNQNGALGDNSLDSTYWQVFTPTADTVMNAICLQIRVPGFSEFYISDTVPGPLGGGVLLDARVLLGGNFNTSSGLMHDSLRVKELLPVINPYEDDNLYPVVGEDIEISYSGILEDLGDSASIVDWVFIELRDASDTSTVIASRAALLRRDGKVVEADGISAVRFTNVDPGNYFVVIKHRNHLSVCTASPVNLDVTATTVDFTDTSGVDLYGTDAVKIVNGRQLMWPGDAGDNGQVKYNGSVNDKNSVLLKVGLGNPNGIITAYDKADVNLDGNVKYNGGNNDKNIILQTVGLGNLNNTKTEQIK